ncbi:hypothetical protein CEY16_00265 [Halalkalibacillus sediminis]|uniref:VWA domain-containing protein n=1 Tax=Halalkalibacillus sediminis TaxID=2018042 RepID=A0A2I0QV61_9BACI|nr:hypothetical protein [Halalkalibacillus sediminis]PKR78227.1 hypothetical protein CEY16_00265 [Halalkalibacillus sediminis]
MTEKKYDITEFPMIFHGYEHLPDLTLGSSIKNKPVSNRQREEIDWDLLSLEATELLGKLNHQNEPVISPRINLAKTLLNYSSFGEPLEERLMHQWVKLKVKSPPLNILLIDTSNSMRSIFSKIKEGKIINYFSDQLTTDNIDVTMLHDTKIYHYKWGSEFSITGCNNGTSFLNPLKSIHQFSVQKGIKVNIFHLSDGGVHLSEWKEVIWLVKRLDYYYCEVVYNNKSSKYIHFLEAHLKSEKIRRKNLGKK